MSTAASSTTSAISGLGISFTSSPPPPAHPHLPPSSHYDPRVLTQQYHLAQRSLHHSVSYDGGLRDKANYGDIMVREGSDDSNAYRRGRIASHTPEVLGGGAKGHYQQVHHLSPLSEFEHSSGSSQDNFSPASLSSLPSSTASDAHYPRLDEHQQHFYSHAPHPQLRHAQSMEVLSYGAYAPGMQAYASQPYPPQRTSYYRPHPNPVYDDEEPAAAPAPTSRLPAFLQERQRSGNMARPKSMVELGQLYAMQEAAPDPSQEPSDQHYAASVEDHHAYSMNYDSRQHDDDDDEQRYGDQSPESVPSSAGGLQRRNLERQLQQQHEFYQQQQRKRLYSSERQLPTRLVAERPATRARARSMSATDRIPRRSASDDDEEEQEEPQEDRPRAARPKSEVLTVGAFVGMGDSKAEQAPSASSASGSERASRRESIISSVNSGATALSRQSTLLTVGANPVRRSKELDRLLAPTAKKSTSAANLAVIAGSPTPSASSSSAATASTRQRASSRASSHPSTASAAVPVALEQGKSTSKARVELDLELETSLVVEGGALKGRMEVRVRKMKDRESEVWVGKPKIRVVGFEELSVQDARHIFYHHASSVATVDSSKGPQSLPCFESDEDAEGFHKARVGQHTIPFKMLLPIGKGAKGGWKGKQGVVRYIVIASVKLKSKSGGDRSIAHFYRHVDIYPYFNPAVLLAPALQPLCANASKGLFMGGSGKVNLSASMHRATWVAGQRCYVDVQVDNESSKKIKSLTLSLIRTTTIFRPRPYLDAAATQEATATDDLEAGAVQTQSTRKKVAESILEMGKKGTKGVTAKGSWMGVDGGEKAEFSHFLLVPHDALSILRGRHVEVTYSIKVSVGGSLSADVSADIPIRVVNFVSLDPPPGHSGDPSASHQLQSRPLAKSWSIDHLRGTPTRRPAPSSMSRMASLDSLRLSDLNGGRGPSRAGQSSLSRVASVDSIRTNDLSRAQSEAGANASSEMARGVTEPTELPSHETTIPRDRMLVSKALERQLSHQMSLDCISSAIASATARRQGHKRTESGLRSVESHADIERWEENGDTMEQDRDGYFGGGGERLYDGQYEPFQDVYGPEASDGIQLDDLDDEQDDIVLPSVHLAGDVSYDALELEAVMQSRFSDDEEEEEDQEPSNLRPTVQAPSSPHRSRTPVADRSPVVRSRPTSPVKQEVARPKSAMKRSDKFAFATPSSPIKSNVELPPVPASPVRRSASPTKVAPSNFPAPPPRSTARPLPPRPTNVGPSTVNRPTQSSIAREQAAALKLDKKPSMSSLKRTPGVVRKNSSRSLQPSPTLSQTSDAPELDSSSSAKSSPDLDAAHTPPQSSSPTTSPTISVLSPHSVAREHRQPIVQAMPIPTSPRKVTNTRSPVLPSPARPLRAARSMMDLRTAPAPPPPRKQTTVLPSVKSKIAALETRQAALARLTGNTDATAMARSNSIMSDGASSVASFKLTDLARANSMASFKAPMLRRKEHREI